MCHLSAESTDNEYIRELYLYMMENSSRPEVSVIVPVYNVEKYLRECLESIESQTFTDWECVVVDDGATDRSGEICDEFARRDSRFKVLHVKNGGLASARNNGIREAKGKYIAFCDSDDWFAPEAIEKMHSLAVSADADVVQTGLWKEFDGYRREKRLVDRRIVLSRDEAIKELVRDKMIPNYMWNKMFRREIIGADFPEGMAFEDVYVCTMWFPRMRRMVCDPTPLYHYRMRAGSILHVGSTKYRLDFLKVMRFRAAEILKLGLDVFTQRDHDVLVAKASVNAAKNIARREADRSRREEVVMSISKSVRELSLSDAKSLGLNQWIRFRLLASHPLRFIKLMRMMGKSDIHTRYRTRSLYK